MKMPLRHAVLVCALLTTMPAFTQGLAPAVRAITATESVATAEQRIPGRVEAVHTVELRSRLEGVIKRVHFRDGQYVAKGDLLFELDDAEHRAALQLAQAERTSAGASLRQAQQLLARYQQLMNTQAISHNDLDNARTQRDVAAASVEQAKARVKAREITLSQTRITAPISGRMGHSAVHAGNVVSPASGVLVDLVQLDPIRIAFAVEESRFQEKASLHAEISTLKNAWLAQIGPLNNRENGTLTSIDNHIDPRTASVTLRAEFANAQHRLLPGAGIDVHLSPRNDRPVVTIPASSVQKDAGGFYTWIIDDAGLAQSRRLILEGQHEQAFRVAKGLRAGERVVTQGAQQLRDGTAVRVIE